MPLSRSASSFFDRLFWRPAIRFLVPLSRSAASYSDRLFWRPAIRFPVPLSRSASPFFDRLFWRPAIRFLVPLSRSAASYSDRLFWRPAIRFPVPLSRSATSPSDRLFYRPAIRFSMPVSRSASSFSDRLFWRPGLPFPVPQGLLFAPRFGSLDRLFRRPPSSHPTFPSRLFGWSARSLCRLTVSLRFLPLRGFYRPAVFTAPRFLPLRGFYRSAVFTAPRFLPLHGFYRSAVFTAPLSPVFFGGSALPPPSCLLPPSLPPLPDGSLLVPPCGSTAIFTAPRFFPLRGFYRSAVFTAPLSPVPWGALLFHRPRACCPPVFPHFRAARSLGHLTVRLRFLPLRGFYRSAIFTAPRFLPLRGFYRSAIFTAPRFLPLRDFFRSAFAGSLGGSTLPFCPPVFALFRAHPVLPAPP